MTLQNLVGDLPVTGREVDLSHIPDKTFPAVGKAIINLMNISGVMTKHGTHYNTREEAEAAMKIAHKEVFKIDRGIYLLIHALDGVTDYSVQKAATALMCNPWDKFNKSILPIDVETKGVQFIVNKLPANRLLNLFGDFRNLRVNNSRTKRRLILPSILGSRKLELWVVKYRRKTRKALEHALGKRRTGIIKSILAKMDFTKDTLEGASAGLKFSEVKMLADEMGSYIVASTVDMLDFDIDKNALYGYQCVSFALQNKQEYTLPLLSAFYAARDSLQAGRKLPMEVLEGIRSTYHKEVSQEAILSLSKDVLTNKQKTLVQRKAKEVGVQVKFDPMKADMLELYKLAFETGMTNGIWKALQAKGKRTAGLLPIRYGKVGILVDASFSMSGSVEQPLRPMAIALGMKDVLSYVADKVVILTTNGDKINRSNPLPRPTGRSDLATGLLDLAEKKVDAIFIISDGYENAPSGRVNEVMLALRHIGIMTPAYHINPTVGAETETGVRKLSDKIPTLPMSNPQKVGLMLFRAMMEVDVKQGIQALVSMALPRIQQKGRKEIAHG